MNGPPVILILALIGVIFYASCRYVSTRWRDDLYDLHQADVQRERARAEFQRRHPSGHDS